MQIDPGQGRRKLAQVGGRRAHQRRELPEAPMRRRNRRFRAGQHQGETLGIVSAGLHPHRGALHRTRPALFRAAVDGREQRREGQEALVRRAREPLGRHAADALAPGHVHLVAAGPLIAVQHIDLGHGHLRDGPAGSLSLELQTHRENSRRNSFSYSANTNAIISRNDCSKAETNYVPISARPFALDFKA